MYSNRTPLKDVRFEALRALRPSAGRSFGLRQAVVRRFYSVRRARRFYSVRRAVRSPAFVYFYGVDS